MSAMTLDFNQLRLNIQDDYNAIVGQLNEYKNTDDDPIDYEQLHVNLTDLRSHIQLLFSIYSDDDDDQNIIDEINLEIPYVYNPYLDDQDDDVDDSEE